MGGKTAMRFSLKYPELIQKLIVLDTSPREYPVLHQAIIDSLKEIDLSIYNTRNSVDDKLKESIKQKDLRNFLMKNTNVIHKLTKSIWGYDSKKQIDQI